MLVVALGGLGVNLVAMWLLRTAGRVDGGAPTQKDVNCGEPARSPDTPPCRLRCDAAEGPVVRVSLQPTPGTPAE
jgi:hypothetical protein